MTDLATYDVGARPMWVLTTTLASSQSITAAARKHTLKEGWGLPRRPPLFLSYSVTYGVVFVHYTVCAMPVREPE